MPAKQRAYEDLRNADDVLPELRHVGSLVETMTALYTLLEDRYISPAEVAAAFDSKGLPCVKRYDSRDHGAVLGHLNWFDEGDELIVRLPRDVTQGRARFLGEWLTNVAEAMWPGLVVENARMGRPPDATD